MKKLRRFLFFAVLALLSPSVEICAQTKDPPKGTLVTIHLVDGKTRAGAPLADFVLVDECTRKELLRTGDPAQAPYYLKAELEKGTIQANLPQGAYAIRLHTKEDWEGNYNFHLVDPPGGGTTISVTFAYTLPVFSRLEGPGEAIEFNAPLPGPGEAMRYHPRLVFTGGDGHTPARLDDFSLVSFCSGQLLFRKGVTEPPEIAKGHWDKGEVELFVPPAPYQFFAKGSGFEPFKEVLHLTEASLQTKFEYGLRPASPRSTDVSRLLNPSATVVVGSVADAETGEPLEGAIVQQVGGKALSVTDEQGFFILVVPLSTSPKETSTSLQVESRGHKKAVLSIPLAPGAHIDESIQLTRNASEMSAATSQEEAAHSPSYGFRNPCSTTAGYLMNQGRLSEAVEILQDAVRREEAAPGESRGLEDCLSELGQALERGQQYDEQSKALLRLAALQEKKYGAESRQLAWTLAELGRAYMQLERFEQADEHLRRALDISPKLDNWQRETAIVLSRLGRLYDSKERFKEAERFFLDALALCRDSAEPDFSCQQTEQDLAYCYAHAGRFPEAEKIIRDAIAREEKVVRPGNVRIESYYQQLAEFAVQQGRMEEGVQFHRQALAVAEKNPDDAWALREAIMYLAMGLHVGGELEEAEKLYRRLVAHSEQMARTGDNNALSMALSSLSQFLASQQRFSEAEPPLLRAMALAGDAPNDQNAFDLYFLFRDYADLLEKTNRGPLAETYRARAKAIQAKHPELPKLD